MKLIANIVLFTLAGVGYIFLAEKDANPRILMMLPFQFVLGVICLFIKPVWKSGFGMMLSIMILYSVYIYQVLQGNQNPFTLIENLIPAIQSF